MNITLYRHCFFYRLNLWVSGGDRAGRLSCWKNKCVTSLPSSSLSSLTAHCCLWPFKLMLWIQSYTVTTYLHFKLCLFASMCVCVRNCAYIGELMGIISLHVNNWCFYLLPTHLFIQKYTCRYFSICWKYSLTAKVRCNKYFCHFTYGTFRFILKLEHDSRKKI